MNIYVGNLSFDYSDEELNDLFATHGEIESARIITDRDSGRSKGFGFVEMPDRDQAMAAIEAINGTEVGGRAITVNEARPKPDRGDRRGGRGGGGGRGRY